ncbi:MAG: sigma 54-interacting transcriptional regulator [Acidobacteria bacterium]|nr:sigma 54-interacting transcriptional regulator [Acidobacteriota bacterium]
MNADVQQLTRERDRLRLLLEITNAVVAHLDLRDLLHAISTLLGHLVPHDLSNIALYDLQANGFRVVALDFPEHQDFVQESELVPIGDNPVGLSFTTGRPVLHRRIDLDKFPAEIMRRVVASGIRSGCSVPLISHQKKLGVLSLGSRRESAFTEDDVELLGQIGNRVAIAVENALAYHEIATLKARLQEENVYLQEEIRQHHNFKEIIGGSPAIKKVLREIETVAATDSTVLILGETGTGKELVARAIHSLSARREHTLVKINCAAIPTGLLESELFGHEKGAFTGAISQRVGRFELANKGTLFLDEVGDIPLELQPKLLRVLQEQEFERLGNARTQKVDVRLIAATNANLEELIAEKKFRSDLYYRLNVFPITVPPLRERREDIPELARWFTQKFASRMRKPIRSIPPRTLSTLAEYHWPGNVRELENLIERAVILSSGPELEVFLPEPKAPAAAVATESVSRNLNFEDAEREHILRVLRDTNWIIGGPRGAASKLGLNRSTLRSKMSKLGITRPC